MSAAPNKTRPSWRAAPVRRSVPGALSDRECRAATCPPERTELMLHDGASLYLRVRQSGRKSWVFLYGSRPRLRVAHPGTFPEFSLAKARLWAAEQRDALRSNAADPVARARQERVSIAVARTQTLAALTDTIWEEMRERGQASWETARSMFKHTPEWAAKMQPIHITRDHAEQILREVAAANPETKIIRHYSKAISAAFGRAVAAKAGIDPKMKSEALAAFGVRDNPFLGLKHGVASGTGGRALGRAEAQAFIQRLKTEVTQDDKRDLLLLTFYMAGQRSVQLAGAVVTVEPETQAPCLKMIDRKDRGGGGVEHIMPLQGPALELLTARGMLTEGASIFGVDYKGAYALAEAAGQLCRRLVREWKLDYFSKGAIRKTASTAFAALGIDEKWVNKMLSHGKSTIDSKHYNRWEYLPEKRELLTKFQAWLVEPETAPKRSRDAGKVVPLRAAA